MAKACGRVARGLALRQGGGSPPATFWVRRSARRGTRCTTRARGGRTRSLTGFRRSVFTSARTLRRGWPRARGGERRVRVLSRSDARESCLGTRWRRICAGSARCWGAARRCRGSRACASGSRRTRARTICTARRPGPGPSASHSGRRWAAVGRRICSACASWRACCTSWVGTTCCCPLRGSPAARWTRRCARRRPTGTPRCLCRIRRPGSRRCSLRLLLVTGRGGRPGAAREERRRRKLRRRRRGRAARARRRTRGVWGT